MSLILLCGGRGTRLNADKAFLKFNDSTIIENVIEKLVDLFDEIILVANYNLEKYNEIIKKYNNKSKNKKIMIVEDLIKNKGPLGGIYTGLKTAKDENNLVLGCDMPFVNADLVKYMLRFDNYDAVVSKHKDKIEPLYSVYNKNITQLIESQIKNNNLKIRDMIYSLKKVKYIEEKDIKRFDKNLQCFFNINNKYDLDKAKIIAENGK